MLMKALIFFFLSPLLVQSVNLSTEHPPALWINNDFNLNHSNYPGNSYVRVILSQPISGLDPNRFVPGASPAVVCGFICNQIDQFDCSNSFLFAAVLLYSYSVNSSLSGSSFPAQVVWSANRDRPVSENATLQFSHDGDLILKDADGTQVWSTDTAGRSVAGMRVAENGRLELFDNKNVSVWDSFDYPTDTWLHGQTLREGQQLIANVSATNFTRGQFYLSVVSGGLEAYIDSEPPQLYYQNKFKSWNKSTYIAFTNGSLDILSSAMDTPNYENAIVSLHASSLQFMRLEFDGHLRHYEWDTYGWALLDDAFDSKNTVWAFEALIACSSISPHFVNHRQSPSLLWQSPRSQWLLLHPDLLLPPVSP